MDKSITEEELRIWQNMCDGKPMEMFWSSDDRFASVARPAMPRLIVEVQKLQKINKALCAQRSGLAARVQEDADCPDWLYHAVMEPNAT